REAGCRGRARRRDSPVRRPVEHGSMPGSSAQRGAGISWALSCFEAMGLWILSGIHGSVPNHQPKSSGTVVKRRFSDVELFFSEAGAASTTVLAAGAFQVADGSISEQGEAKDALERRDNPGQVGVGGDERIGLHINAV